MYVTNLSIREFRCIAHADIDFQHPDSPGADRLELPNANLLTGLNGGGKSTVLKALVAAALGARLQARQFTVTNWVRRGSQGDCRLRAGLLCHPTDGMQSDELDTDLAKARSLSLAVRIHRDESSGREELWSEAGDEDAKRTCASDDGPGFFLVAYGPSRQARAPWKDAGSADASPGSPPFHRIQFGEPPSNARLERVASLLDEHALLQPLEDWLPETMQSEPERYEEITRLLSRTIPPSTRFLGKQEDGNYLFEHDDVAVPYEALSEGLRSHIAWIADLLYHLHRAAPEGVRLDDLPGVVLVDEIDQRLHPRWQLDLLSWLSSALPRLQFLFTSHSPLLAGSLRPSNIAVLVPNKDDDGTGSRPRRMLDDVFGRSADGVLTSSYFDLASTRADPFRQHLRGLVELARAGDKDAPLQLMRVLGDPGKMKPLAKKPLGKKDKEKDKSKKKDGGRKGRGKQKGGKGRGGPKR